MSGELYAADTRPNYPANYPGGTDAGELVEKLLSNKELEELLNCEILPKYVRIAFKSLFSRDTRLTFLTPDEINRRMLDFEYIRITALESIPKADYQEEMELLLYTAKSIYYNILCRARGRKMNERELMTASVNATFAERPIGGNQSENLPFFNRLISAGNSLIKGGGQQ